MSLTQYAFRFYNDDGGEATSTPFAAENANISWPLDTNVVLRLGVTHDGSAAPSTSKYMLFAARVGTEAWFEVSPAGAGKLRVAKSSGSPNNITAGGVATTQRLSAPGVSPSPAFVAGRMWDDESGQDSVAIGNAQCTELGWCIQAVSANGALAADQYKFHVLRVPPVVGGPITMVGSPVTSFSTGTSNQITKTGVSAGNLLTLQFSYFQASTTALATPTDSNGTLAAVNAPTGQLVDGSSHLTGAQIWHIPNANGGDHTITIPLTSGGDVWATLIEWSGFPTSALVDAAPASDQSGVGGVASITSGTTPTLAQANELALIAMGTSNTGPGNAATDITNPPAGWTGVNYSGDTTATIGAQHSYKIVAATTALTAAWGWTNDSSTNGAQGVIGTLKGN